MVLVCPQGYHIESGSLLHQKPHLLISVLMNRCQNIDPPYRKMSWYPHVLYYWVLNWDFSADSDTQCLRISYLLSFNTVGQGRSCFSLKLLTNNYKLNVFGSFLVHPNRKDFKSLFIIGEFLVALFFLYRLN